MMDFGISSKVSSLVTYGASSRSAAAGCSQTFFEKRSPGSEIECFADYDHGNERFGYQRTQKTNILGHLRIYDGFWNIVESELTGYLRRILKVGSRGALPDLLRKTSAER